MEEHRLKARDQDDISISDIYIKILQIISTIKKKSFFLISIVLIFLIIGFIYAFGSHEEYISSARIIPYKGKKAQNSNIGGLAGLAGINLGGQSSDLVISVDLYKEVVNSLLFRETVSTIPLEFETPRNSLTFYYYMDSVYQPSFSENFSSWTLGFPNQIFGLFKSDKPSNISGNIVVEPDNPVLKFFPGQKFKILNDLRDRITIEHDELTGILNISTRMPDRFASAHLAKIVIDQLKNTITHFELQKNTEQLIFIEKQYLDAKKSFENSQNELAYFQDRNKGLVSSSARIQEQHLQNEYNLSYEIFRNIANQREQMKLKQKEDSPVFTILESPYVPNKPSTPKKFKILTISVILGFITGIFFIIINHIVRDNRSVI